MIGLLMRFYDRWQDSITEFNRFIWVVANTVRFRFTRKAR